MTDTIETIGASDAADLLGLKYQTFYQRVVRGYYEELQYVKRKGQLRFRRDDIEDIKEREDAEFDALVGDEDVA